MISLHIPSLTGRETVKINPVFYQHAVPDGTDGFQELRVKNENRERKAEGTKARKHEGTKARKHEGTKARKHEGTKGRKRESGKDVTAA
ncbi:MAG: hypothetical protein LBG15_05910 [Dysgonamonadaceae bacterium]|jgi:hypothetical protein|nr:hypothetical protein [Dysgonamonadaceae bacterium]